MPAIIFLAIAIAIVLMGIGGAVALPQMPEAVIRPVAEKSIALFGPLLVGVFIALILAGCVYVYLKFKGKEGR